MRAWVGGEELELVGDPRDLCRTEDRWEYGLGDRGEDESGRGLLWAGTGECEFA